MRGFSHLYFQGWNRIADLVQPGAVILLYHRVILREHDPQQLAVSPDHFYDQVSFLKSHYHLCMVEEFSSLVMRKKRFPPKSLLITFDDGYADNFLSALPVLSSLGAQALFYITTSRIGSDRELWWDELERVLLATAVLPPQLNIDIGKHPLSRSIHGDGDRRKVYRELLELLRYCSPELIEATLAALVRWSSCGEQGRPMNRMMNPTEIRELASNPSAVIGCHTHRHPALGMLPYEKQYQEISQSRKILETLIGSPVRHFSYPFGSRKLLGNKRCYNRDSVRACRELGFDLVTANYPGQVHTWSNRFTLPRQLVRNWDNKEFSSAISEFFHQ
ncbi:MAG TPA: polysaccharide deacetylase family protein [Chitinophagaceae bacterium]|nr:polysaccharide deacetylase family protein [Chitinophagaceae bacterium]